MAPSVASFRLDSDAGRAQVASSSARHSSEGHRWGSTAKSASSHRCVRRRTDLALPPPPPPFSGWGGLQSVPVPPPPPCSQHAPAHQAAGVSPLPLSHRPGTTLPPPPSGEAVPPARPHRRGPSRAPVPSLPPHLTLLASTVPARWSQRPLSAQPALGPPSRKPNQTDRNLPSPGIPLSSTRLRTCNPGPGSPPHSLVRRRCGGGQPSSLGPGSQR